MNINIPVKIITKKISMNKTDSIFYAGKNIASVTLKDREYILSTAGEYSFSFKEKGKVYTSSSITGRVSATSRLTDSIIKKLDSDSLIKNWGWFGINFWVRPPGDNGLFETGKWTCLPWPTDVYSQYDEALKAFKKFVTSDLIGTSILKAITSKDM